MCGKIRRGLRLAAFALLCAFASVFSAFAGVDNPHMGDNSGRYLGVVIAIMGVALVVIVALLLVSSKKKK